MFLCFKKCAKKNKHKEKKNIQKVIQNQNTLDIQQQTQDKKDFYQSGNIICQQNNKKIIKEVLSEKGQALILKEISFQEDYLYICEDLAELINFAAHEYVHPNLVKYVKAFYNSKTFTIITEKVSLSFYDIQFNEKEQIAQFIIQILSAIQFLYQQDIYNVNLRPNNIFINEFGLVKIRDYIGKSFFELLENGSGFSESLETKRTQEVEKDISDLIDLIKLLWNKLDDQKSYLFTYRSFLNNLETMKNEKQIDFQKLLQHNFLQLRSKNDIQLITNPSQSQKNHDMSPIQMKGSQNSLAVLENKAKCLLDMLNNCSQKNHGPTRQKQDLQIIKRQSENLLKEILNTNKNLERIKRQAQEKSKIKQILSNYNRNLKSVSKKNLKQEITFSSMDEKSDIKIEQYDEGNQKRYLQDFQNRNFKKKKEAQVEEVRIDTVEKIEEQQSLIDSINQNICQKKNVLSHQKENQLQEIQEQFSNTFTENKSSQFINCNLGLTFKKIQIINSNLQNNENKVQNTKNNNEDWLINKLSLKNSEIIKNLNYRDSAFIKNNIV